MARLDNAIYKYLIAQSGITNLVGSRIYPDMLPEGCAFPAVTFQQISLLPRYSHAGDVNLDTARVQFDIYADERQSACDIADTLRLVLSGTQTYYDNIAIQAFFLANEPFASYDQAIRKWRRTIDYLVMFKRV